MSDSRKEQLSLNLARVRDRIQQAALAVGRDPEEITLVVVTKYFPASDVRLLAGLGVGDVGENKHQEASAKVAECAEVPVRWHFIGGIQSNKAAQIAGYADVVQSVDRIKLVSRLAQGAGARQSPLEVLIQVSLDSHDQGNANRQGIDPEQVAALADLIAQTPALELRGVMGVAPLGVQPEPAFTKLAAISQELRTQHPAATWISAGMSGDLEAAISAGATHVRVGSGILGPRPVMK
ncbi:MAG TPA: YggS family pyridoxal phosphate-dependent enzyme [Marmoricola sp.]|nr:YggS family pyridoxal phosphate-dependent enzyme [Marmoricola sp.]HNN48693.1 YggS family pyridoxal phosphate-dependent enzyme [Marmoricola sp.]